MLASENAMTETKMLSFKTSLCFSRTSVEEIHVVVVVVVVVICCCLVLFKCKNTTLDLC